MSLRPARLRRLALMLLFASPALPACQASPDADADASEAADAHDAGVQPPQDAISDGSVLSDVDAEPDPDAALPPAAPCPSGPYGPLPACTPALEGTRCYQSDCVRNATDQIGATYLCSDEHWDVAERGGWDCGPVEETCAELGAVPGAPCPAELDGWGCDLEVVCPDVEPSTELIACYDGHWGEPWPCQ